MPADPKLTHLVAEWKHDAPFISARFDPQGRFVFAGAQDNTVQRWDLASGKQTALKDAHDSWVRAICFDGGGEELITGGFDGRLYWWETAAQQPKPLRQIDAHDGWVRSLDLSPDGQLLATTGNDNLVKLWNAADGSPVRQMAGHQRHVYNALFHPDGKSLVSVDLMSEVKVWNLADGKLLREFKAEDLHKYDKTFRADIGGARSIAISQDGKTLACGGITNVTNAFAGIGNPAVMTLDWEKGEKKQLHKPKENLQGVAWGIEFHPDGYLICSSGGGAGGYLFFYKPAEASQFHQLKLKSQARDLDLHPDGVQLVVPHYDNHVRLYAMAKKEEKKG